MMKRAALRILALGPPVILLCFLLPGTRLGGWLPLGWAQGLSALVVLLLAVAMCVLGAARGAERGGDELGGDDRVGDDLGPLRAPMLILVLLLLGSTLAMVLLPEDATLAGLPASMVVMLLGLGLGPLLLTSWAYAATFDSFTLTEEDLRRLQEFEEET